LDDARPLLTCLVDAKTGQRRSLLLTEIDKDKRKLLQPFIDSSLVTFDTDEKTGEERVELAHDLIVATWPQLNQWIAKDNEFLIWRQELSTKVEGWKRAGETNDLLLTSTSITEAKHWINEHEKSLFQSEIDYIKKSIAYREKRRKRKLSVLIVVPVILLLLAITYVLRQNSAQVALANTDSAQARAYNFTTQYSSAANPNLDFYLAMLKDYYRLDKEYQENLKATKQEIENNIYYKFYAIVDTFYSSLRNKTFNAATFFDDSVSFFGNLKNLSPEGIQSKVDALSKINITNSVMDTTLNFRSDSEGFYVSFRENGNVLLDALKEYKEVEHNTEIAFTDNFRIRSFKYNDIKADALVTTVATPAVQQRINLFTCGTDRYGEIAISRAMLLLKKHNYNVVRKGFKNPSDKYSPYFIGSNEIRYADMDDAAMAAKVKTLLELNTKAAFSIKRTKTATPNVVSIYYCEGSPINIQQTETKY
jgi:flagellar basal body-associated protein FliL